MRWSIVDCASCGAPLGGPIAQLRDGALAPCLYCGALLRFRPGDAASPPSVESQLSPELVARIREAALRGARAEAIAIAVNDGGVTEAAAAVAVDDVIQNVARRTVFDRTLDGIGWSMVSGGVALTLGGLAILAWPSPARLFGLVFLGFGLANLAFLARGVRTSLRFARASRGTARVVRSVRVGPTGFSDGCAVYSLALDVTPSAGGAPFHTRLVLPVRPTSLSKVAEGATLRVRYEDGGAWVRSDG